MSESLWSTFWHRWLRRPYRLAKTFDTGGQRPAVVLLHGIGRTGQVWHHILPLLESQGIRAVAFDLLGFGASAKPQWLRYDADDHARSVIASLERLKLDQPTILVGHSMGCLIAVRVARLRPDLVKHLVLYEMPLYEGLPQKRRYRLRTDLYYRFYSQVIAYRPTFNPTTMRLAERLANKVVGMEVTAETWQPFIKSLQHTIMQQTTAADIKQLTVAMDVIYGSLDILVIRGEPRHIFGSDRTNITAHTVRAGHAISPKASQLIVSRIVAALEDRSIMTARQAAREQ